MANKQTSGAEGADETGAPIFSPGSHPAPRITLPSGEVIYLADWIYGSLYAAAVVQPYGDAYDMLEPFAAGRSQQLAGAPAGENATSAHTNIPRNGDNGLPRDWEMYVSGFQAKCSLPLEQPVVDFASDCATQFVYNGIIYGQCRLIDLLLGSVFLSGEGGALKLPIHMKENLSYGIKLIPQSKAGMDSFQAYLRSGATSVDPTVIAELDQLSRIAAPPIGAEIKRIQAKLQPGKRATFWLGIDGYIKRTVV